MRQAATSARDPKPSKRRDRATAACPQPPTDALDHALHYIRQQIDTGRLRPTIRDLTHLLRIRHGQQPAAIVACWYSPNTPHGTCPVCLRPSDPAATARFHAALDAQRPHQEHP